MSLKPHTQSRNLSVYSLPQFRFWMLGGLLLLGGCAEQETIHSYVAPKVQVPEDDPLMNRGVAVSTRMLAAILRQPNETWFFKLTAPPAEAASFREEFGTFVASTVFENDRPSWQIPDDWIEQPERPMRFTTYRIGAGGPEVSISTLPNNAAETESAVANINRWRGQLALDALEAEQYLKALEKGSIDTEILPEGTGEIVTITTPAGKAVLIDFVGEMSSGGGAPFANMGRGPSRPSPSNPTPPPASSREPKLSPADHWRPGKLNSFRIAAYEVGQGEEIAEITLSTAGGDLLANVNRWRGQVDLPAWTADELAEKKVNLIGQGYIADYVKLIGPAKAILGAVINHEGRTWFVKLTGPKALAEQELKNFESFVKSIEF